MKNNPLNLPEKGFALLIGLLITALIIGALASISILSVNSKKDREESFEKNILNNTEERIKNISEQRLKLQQELEKIEY